LTGYKFDVPNEPPPRDVNDDVRRKEEEELQRVLELSVQDKGGKAKWSDYTLTSAGAAGQNPGQSSSKPYRAPPVESGYVPASAVPPQVHVQINSASVQQPSKELVSPVNPTPSVLVTRVRALHSFEPTDAGELSFERGDVIKVVDRGYKDWWRGQLRGRTGIFPVNYVVSERATYLSNILGSDRSSRSRCQNRHQLNWLERSSKRLRCSPRRRTLTSCWVCSRILTLRGIILRITRKSRFVLTSVPDDAVLSLFVGVV